MIITPFDMMLAVQRNYLQMIRQMGQAAQDALVPLAQTSRETSTSRAVAVRRETDSEKSEQIIQFGEERLEVGTRKVYGDATRVRRVVHEVPVMRRVELTDETIVVERRKTDGRSVFDSEAIQEREYVMMDSREIPVVSKQMHLHETVVLRRQRAPRVEIIKETVRRAAPEVTQPTRLPVIIAPDKEVVVQKSDQQNGEDQSADYQNKGDHQDEQHPQTAH